GDRAEFAGRNFHGQIERSLMADIHNYWIRTGLFRASTACEKVRNFFNGFLCGRKTDANWHAIGKSFQPLQRKREMSAALVVCDSVDFVHNDGLYITKNRPASFRRQQN